MEKEKHAPTPWKQGDGDRWDSAAIFTDDGTGFQSSGRYIARCEGTNSGFDNDANAAFIVQAVNFHDEMRAKLEEIMASNMIPCEAHERRFRIRGLLEKVAKAEGLV